MTVFLVIHAVIVTLLILVILMQRSATDGFTGASGGNSMFSSRTSANVMTRATAILATLFIVNSLILAAASSNAIRETSLIDKIEADSKLEETIEVKPVEEEEIIPNSVPIAE